MANFLPRSVILTMVVSFSVSFAIMYWQRKTQQQPVPIAEAASGIAVSAPPAAPIRPPMVEHQEPIVPASRTAANADRPTETVTPDEEAAAEVLPVAFHIRNRRDLNKIDGDIRNITSKPMSITL